MHACGGLQKDASVSNGSNRSALYNAASLHSLLAAVGVRAKHAQPIVTAVLQQASQAAAASSNGGAPSMRMHKRPDDTVALEMAWCVAAA